MDHSNERFRGVEISSRTLHPCDLIPTFMDTLESMWGGKSKARKIRGRYPEIFRQAAWRDRRSAWEDLCNEQWDSCEWVMDELFDALEMVAPEGTFFGASEGDSSSFGFWDIDEY